MREERSLELRQGAHGWGLYTTINLPAGQTIVRENAVAFGEGHSGGIPVIHVMAAAYYLELSHFRPADDPCPEESDQALIYFTNFYSPAPGTTWEHGVTLSGPARPVIPLHGAVGFVVSRINHSCVPCAVVELLRGAPKKPLELRLVTLRAIKAGEEITTNYRDIEDVVERRRLLQKDYGFLCECSRCLEELGKRAK